MTAAKLTTLACALRRFFAEHLPQVRGASAHTVRSYRDSLALLLRFAAVHPGGRWPNWISMCEMMRAIRGQP